MNAADAYAAEQRASNTLSNLYDKISKEFIMTLKGDAYRCCAGCCDNTKLDSTSFQRCIEDCCSRLSVTEKYLESELQNLQDRFNRCIHTCNDQIKDKMSSKSLGANHHKYQGELYKCSVLCANEITNLVPSYYVRMKKKLSSISTDANSI